MEERRREALRLRQVDRAWAAALAVASFEQAVKDVPRTEHARLMRRLEQQLGRVQTSQQRTAVGSHRG